MRFASIKIIIMEVKRSGQIWEIFQTMVNEMWGAKENETLEQILRFFTSGMGG